MKAIREKLNQHFWPIAIAAVIIIAGTGYWLAGRYREHKVDTAIEQLQTGSQEQVTAAAEHETTAANTSIERRAEDAVRDRVVRPKLESARRTADRSKREVEQAKEKLNETPQIPHANTDTWAANCARLRRTFPDTDFEYCKGY